MEERIKLFNVFFDNFGFAYRQYWMWRAIVDDKYSNVVNLDQDFWITLCYSLINGHLSELAKILERPSSKFGEVLSIYYLLELDLQEYAQTIEKIRLARNKMLMHLDKKASISGDFWPTLGLEPSEIEKLFDGLLDLLDRMGHQHGRSGLKNYFYDMKGEVIANVGHVMKRIEDRKI